MTVRRTNRTTPGCQARIRAVGGEAPKPAGPAFAQRASEREEKRRRDREEAIALQREVDSEFGRGFFEVVGAREFTSAPRRLPIGTEAAFLRRGDTFAAPETALLRRGVGGIGPLEANA